MTRVKGVGLHVYPAPMVHESRLLRMSASLQASGLFSEVHLVGTGTEHLPRREQLEDGRRIVRLGGRPGVKRSLPSKIWSSLRWQPRVYREYHSQELTVVSAHSVWVLPLCWMLSRATGAALVYNAHELETETPSMRGTKRFLAKAIERALISRCALITVVNRSISEWYESAYGVRPVTAYNLPVVEEPGVALRELLGLSADDFLYVFTGHLTEGRSIPEIVAAFEQQSNAHVVFIGDGPHGELVRAAVSGGSQVHWLAAVPPSHVVAYVRQADVALCLIETAALSYRLSSPNKLFEALMAGTPVLCSDLVEARRFLGPVADDWILVDPASDLADAIARTGARQVDLFEKTWTGIGTWREEVGGVVRGYEDLMARSE